MYRSCRHHFQSNAPKTLEFILQGQWISHFKEIWWLGLEIQHIFMDHIVGQGKVLAWGGARRKVSKCHQNYYESFSEDCEYSQQNSWQCEYDCFGLKHWLANQCPHPQVLNVFSPCMCVCMRVCKKRLCILSIFYVFNMCIVCFTECMCVYISTNACSMIALWGDLFTCGVEIECFCPRSCMRVHMCVNVYVYISVGVKPIVCIKGLVSQTQHISRGRNCGAEGVFFWEWGCHCCSVNHCLWNHHLNLHRYATVVNGLIGLAPCPAPHPLFPKKRPCPSLPSSENMREGGGRD